MAIDAQLSGALEALREQKIAVLGLKFNNTEISPGDFVKKGDARTTPVISFDTANAAQKYIVLCLDPDAPHPSASFLLSPILHWLQGNLQIPSDGSKVFLAMEAVMAGYRPPNPPGFSPPHRYVFLLYEQPDTLNLQQHIPKDGEQLGLWPRLKYDHDQLVQKMGLGEPVAANYFISS
ncbi:hypothetical protein NQ176_g5070 [Zarea fungicola]|uniref:Uncharacterized protein n=1 Tax=Zarea fungicola TaxID=93591 RepID=A0ACC1NAA8_9HYPO|nr:hypothetical protein NQ176_g5070 [Lecanicillium fungicola]